MTQHERNWSTREMPQSKALAYWKDVICANLLELNIGSAHESDFHGQIVKYALGPLTANFISVTEQHVRRTSCADRNPSEGIYHLIHVRKGVQLVDHYDRKVTVQAGNCVLVDCFSSFDFQFPHGVEALVLEVRRDWIRSWLPEPEAAVAKVVDHRSGWGRTLCSALDNLTPGSVGSLEVPQAVVAEQIAVLLALSLVQTGPSLTTHKGRLLRQVTSTLRERCHDAELDPAAVADAVGLSRRYVHRLFAAAGTTFTQELYKVRLERAQRLLTDKRFEDVRISEIAWNCGFSEPSHFTRRFRDKFGVPPSAFRDQANG